MTIQETFDKWRMNDEAFSQGHFGTSPDEREIIRDLWLAVKAEALKRSWDKPISEAQRLAQEAQTLMDRLNHAAAYNLGEIKAMELRDKVLNLLTEAVELLAGERR
jgi:hypothetical protein